MFVLLWLPILASSSTILNVFLIFTITTPTTTWGAGVTTSTLTPQECCGQWAGDEEGCTFSGCICVYCYADLTCVPFVSGSCPECSDFSSTNTSYCERGDCKYCPDSVCTSSSCTVDCSTFTSDYPNCTESGVCDWCSNAECSPITSCSSGLCSEINNRTDCQSATGCSWCISKGQCQDLGSDDCDPCSDYFSLDCGNVTNPGCAFCLSEYVCKDSSLPCQNCSSIDFRTDCQSTPGCSWCISQEQCQDLGSDDCDPCTFFEPDCGNFTTNPGCEFCLSENICKDSLVPCTNCSSIDISLCSILPGCHTCPYGDGCLDIHHNCSEPPSPSFSSSSFLSSPTSRPVSSSSLKSSSSVSSSSLKSSSYPTSPSFNDLGSDTIFQWADNDVEVMIRVNVNESQITDEFIREFVEEMADSLHLPTDCLSVERVQSDNGNVIITIRIISEGEGITPAEIARDLQELIRDPDSNLYNPDSLTRFIDPDSPVIVIVIIETPFILASDLDAGISVLYSRFLLLVTLVAVFP